MGKNEFYLITGGQLAVVWIFGIIGALFCFGVAGSGEDMFFGLLGIAILFFVVFYTIGWKTQRNTRAKNTDEK